MGSVRPPYSQMHKLDSSTVRFINCAQVITNSECVVKELVENALDAGAKRITVSMSNYGLDKIEVVDNGIGISASDAILMAQRHTTSKLVSFSDLADVVSYGFRGEALASVCSLAIVKVSTRLSSEDVGRCYAFGCDGNVVGETIVACQPGTSVVVTQLFHKFPVRRQRLSTLSQLKQTLYRIERCLLGLSLAQPQLHLLLNHDRDRLFTRPSCADRAAAVSCSLGQNKASQLTRIVRESRETCSWRIEVFVPVIGAVTLFKTTTEAVIVIVNGRVVVAKDIVKVVREVCSSASSLESRYPTSVIYVDLPTSQTDINLEPNKSIVKISNVSDLLEDIRNMLLDYYNTESTKNVDNIQDRSEPVLNENVSADCPAPSLLSTHDATSTPNTYKTNNGQSEIKFKQSPLPFIHHSRDVSSSTRLDDDSFTVEITPQKKLSASSKSPRFFDSMEDSQSTANNSPTIIQKPMLNSANVENQFSLSQWSRGNIPTIIKPPSEIHVLNSVSSNITNKRPTNDNCTPPAHKKKPRLEDSPTSLNRPLQTIKLAERQPQGRSSLPIIIGRKTQRVAFSLDAIRDLYRNHSRSRKMKPPVESGQLRHIGSLQTPGISVLLQEGNTLLLTNENRVLECSIFHRLMLDCQLVSVSLDSPTLITSEDNEYDKVWSSLEGLRTQLVHNSTTQTSERVISDPRIVSNGFRIHAFNNTTNINCKSFLVVRAPCNVDNHIGSLRELCSRIKEGPESSEWHCRPTSVIPRIQEDAQRQAKEVNSTPNIKKKFDWSNTLADLKDYLKNSQSFLCWHGNKIYEKLSSLPPESSVVSDIVGDDVMPYSQASLGLT